MVTAMILGASVGPNGPSRALIRRTACAARLYHIGEVDHLILCGGVVDAPTSEAEAMRDLLLEYGVPEAAISLEPVSTNTLENIQFGKELLFSESVTIVTDWFHAPRAKLIAKSLGLKPRMRCLPVERSSIFVRFRAALREVVAIPIYRHRLRKLGR